MKNLMVVFVLALVGCGGPEPVEPTAPVVIGEVMNLAPAYVGELLFEVLDENGAVIERETYEDIEVHINDIGGRTLVEGLYANDEAEHCSVEIDDMGMVLDQSCVVFVEDAEVLLKPLGTVSGDAKALQIDLGTSFEHVGDDVTGTITQLFEGLAMPEEPTVVVDDPGESTTIESNNADPATDGEEVSCSTNADCQATERCRSGACAALLTCSDIGVDYERDGWVWSDCSDGKEYLGVCAHNGAGSRECSCDVNGTITQTWYPSDRDWDQSGEASSAHLVYNERCDWLVPPVQ